MLLGPGTSWTRSVLVALRGPAVGIGDVLSVLVTPSSEYTSFDIRREEVALSKKRAKKNRRHYGWKGANEQVSL